MDTDSQNVWKTEGTLKLNRMFVADLHIAGLLRSEIDALLDQPGVQESRGTVCSRCNA